MPLADGESSDRCPCIEDLTFVANALDEEMRW
jgi:hypothetical protein